MAQLLQAEYAVYLSRADARIGEVSVGQYAKVDGRLVKKLSYQEFAERWEQFVDLRQAIERSIARDDTVNDGAMRRLKEAAAELLVRV
jgi:hypothetical protein